MGFGGDIIKGSNDKLYYIGGYDAITKNKSKLIYEYSNTKWSKWPNELMNVDEDALNAWGVMEIGQEFCADKKNITKAISYKEGWILKKPKKSFKVCVDNIFKGDSPYDECLKYLE